VSAGLYYVTVYPFSVATDLDNVQSIQMRVGRTSWGEAPQASQLTVFARYPEGYTTPNDGIVVGGQITLSQGLIATTVWDGVITSIEVEYGKPWNGTEGAGDTVTITAVGYLGELAQYTERTQSAIGGKVLQDAVDELALAGITVDPPPQYLSYLVHANPVTQNVAEWATALSYTLPLFIDEDNAYLRLQLYYGVGPTFTTTSTATTQRYDTLKFTALQLDYASEVTVTGQNTSFSGTANDGLGGPYTKVAITSLSSSDARAAAMADYLFQTYSLQEQRLAQVVALEEQQNPAQLHLHKVRPGTYFRIKFRGDDYDVVVIGYELDARPAEARWTYHVVPLDFAAWFTLDDDNSANDAPSLGALDIGRLGF